MPFPLRWTFYWALDLGRGVSQVLLGKADELFKACGIFNCHVREDFSIREAHSLS